ncbi:MAG: amino acid permease [Myxococcales bacterium]|nr:amino acid permease [Myxococcales bacterium]
MSEESTTRSLGLLGATRIGIGAIVGGGILVLAGTAFAHTGPAAVVAFAVNGLLAVLTAMSFAEMASAFPESGGAYAFARRVLSVRAAFAAGWVLWAAYIVAGVLYALGLGVYGVTVIADLWRIALGPPPAWLTSHGAAVGCATLAISGYALSLIRRATGGGEFETYGKVIVLGVLVFAGLWAFVTSPAGTARATLLPFAPGGMTGLLAAMGFTFIALQGFDLIAAVAGEIRDPVRTIPRAMFLSLAVALAIYLPLLLLVASVGVGPGEDIQSMAQRAPDTLMATAAGNYMGEVGYWLVMIAAVLSTLSALHANLLAASRVAETMAGDRTLPWILGIAHKRRGTPVVAIYASALAMAALLFMLPDLAAAGATASLIFLVSFALAHYTAYLARQRLPVVHAGYRAPLFPLVPVVGGSACLALSIFQAVVEPNAGAIALVWLGLGVLLYLALFSDRAEVVDAAAEARDTTLAKLRGRSPLVLVPVGNPDNAAAMVQVASALAPPQFGKVLLLSVVLSGEDDDGGAAPGGRDAASAARVARNAARSIEGSQRTLQLGLTRAFEIGHRPEATVTVAADPWKEIERVAEERQCERVLIGLSDLDQRGAADNVERLMGRLDCDVSVLRAPDRWNLDEVHRVLVPIGGRGRHDELRARLLSSLGRGRSRQVHFLRVVPEGTSDAELASLERGLRRLAAEEVSCPHSVEIVCGGDPIEVISERAAERDLMVLGLQRVAGHNTFGSLALALARRLDTAIIMVGGKSGGGFPGFSGLTRLPS